MTQVTITIDTVFWIIAFCLWASAFLLLVVFELLSNKNHIDQKATFLKIIAICALGALAKMLGS